jgi:hypothetical protein
MVSNILSLRSFSNARSISSGTDTINRFIAMYLMISIDTLIKVCEYSINRYLMKQDNNRQNKGKEIALNPNQQILRLGDQDTIAMNVKSGLALTLALKE